MNRQERKHAQGELANSPVQFSALIESMDDIIWSVDSENFGLIVYNQAFANLAFQARGIDVRPGMGPDEILPPDQAGIFRQFYAKVLEQGKIDCNHQFVSSTNTFHLTSQRLVRDGHIFGIAVFGHDITRRERIEKALRKSEEKFAKAFRASPMGLAVTSARDHRYLEINECFEQVTGYRQEEIIGKTPYDIHLWVNPEEMGALVGEVLRSGSVRNLEVAVRTKNGEIRHTLGSAELIEIDGEPCLISVFADITDRKRAQEALHESEERLRLAVAAGRMYAFEWDLQSDLVHCSEKYYQILGLPKDAAYRTEAQHLESMPLEDRTHFLAVIKSLNPERPSYRLTYRILRPDDTALWLEESGRACFDFSGTPRRVVGMVADVTESRESQLALSDLSGRLITSQEEERRRVARELHDNIGQELALLTMQAQRLDSGVSDEEHTTHTDMRELYKRTKELAVKVSKLSHRLHSSELDFLGLGVAAEQLCRDFAKQYGIDLDYEIRSVPRKLDRGVSLCFYRILQESLQNVANHSKATRAAVHLSNSKKELTLRIDDNGIGFDVGTAPYKSGLGLISMRERVNLIGGQIIVTSEVGKGTNVKATVAIGADTACKADYPAHGPTRFHQVPCRHM